MERNHHSFKKSNSSSSQSIPLKTILFSLLLVCGMFLAVVVLLEIVLERKKPLEFPFHNVLYPYVEFRPPAKASWDSDKPSPSSRTGEYAIEYTNEDSLRIPSPDYVLHKEKPASQVRIAIVGGSTVRIGTRFEVTLPGALKKILLSRHSGSNIEVINAGIISAISRQELIFLITTLVDHDIDILITYDGINDSGQMLYYERRPNFPYNYRVIEKAWDQYVGGMKGPLWKQILSRSTILARIWPKKFSQSAFLYRVSAAELLNKPDLRQVYAHAYIDNWDKIRRVCAAYGIRAFFVLQPTSLYDLFSNETEKDNPSYREELYANYLVYEDFRKVVQQFAKTHKKVGVLDLSSLLSADAFLDGAHVYDDINDIIVERLADFIANDVVQISKRLKQG